jgi:hypothetical protein
MNKTTATPFVPHAAHRVMTPTDAQIFTAAAERYAHPHVRAAIYDAGGDAAHVAHFSRARCGGRPAVPWCADMGHDDVVAALRATGEALA